MLKFLIEILASSYSLGKEKLAIVFSLLILSTVIELIGLSLIIPLIRIVIDPNNYITLAGVSFFGFLNSENIFNFILPFFFLIFLIKYLFTILIEYLLVRYKAQWEIDLYAKLINNHVDKPLIVSNQNEKLLVKDLTETIPFYVDVGILGSLSIFKNSFILFSLLGFLFFKTGLIAVFVFTIFAFIIYFLLRIFKNYLFRISLNFEIFLKNRYNFIEELTSGLREIKIQKLKYFFLREYSKNENLIAKILVIRKLCTILPKIVIEIFSLMALLFVVYFNSNNPGNLLPFLGVLTFIIYRSQPLMSAIASNIASIQSYGQQIKEGILIQKDSISKNNMEPVNNVSKTQNIKNESILQFKNVNFSYNKNKKIFSNLNLSLKFGIIYGLKGKNGSGKSTFADLACGLLEPVTGEILIDNKNIKNFSDEWMNSISYMSQKFFIFRDTIRNNITFENKINKEFDETQFNKAIEISNLTKMLNDAELNNETNLLDIEKNISGGQKQKIALARMIYKNSNVIILDEPTASLDLASSTKMINELQKIKKNKLIIIISHSDEILKKCDEIMENLHDV